MPCPRLIGVMREMNAAGLSVNVVAHSMGARIVLGATGALCQERAHRVVDQIILSAADVSAEQYNDDFGQLLRRAGPCVQRTTLYASDNDMALVTSESFHGGVPRAGRVPLRNLQYGSGYGAVDVVDASEAPGDSAGHSYFTRSYEMLRDMMWGLGRNTGRAARRAGRPGRTDTALPELGRIAVRRRRRTLCPCRPPGPRAGPPVAAGPPPLVDYFSRSITAISPGPAISRVVAMPMNRPCSTTPGTAEMAEASLGAFWMAPKAMS